MAQKLGEAFRNDHADAGRGFPSVMPTADETAEGIATLEAALQPVDERLAKMIIMQLVDTFPTFGEKMSPERESSRAAAWLAANADLPNDLWQEAKLGVLRSDRKGLPSPGEFRSLVEPQLDRRRRELERLREWQRRPPQARATETASDHETAPERSPEQLKQMRRISRCRVEKFGALPHGDDALDVWWRQVSEIQAELSIEFTQDDWSEKR